YLRQNTSPTTKQPNSAEANYAPPVDLLLRKLLTFLMDVEREPLQQQPIRKAVGRPLSASARLACAEEMAAFLKKYAPGALARAEGDYFPVRKAVGRPRPARR